MPKRQKCFFYGYLVVAGAWLSMFVCSGAQYSFGIFMPVLIGEFGWSRSALSLAFTLNTLIMPFQGLLGGYLVDRIGPRWTVAMGGIIGGIGIALLGTVDEVWQFIAIFGVLVPSGIALSYWVSTIATVRRWFTRRAALMVSLAMTGSGLGIALFTPLSHVMIRAWGWRACYAVLGTILFAGTLIGGSLLKRDPQSAGTYPDGEQPIDAQRYFGKASLNATSNWSVWEAFHQPAWWLIIAAQLGYSLALMGFLGHLITWGSRDLGIPLGTMVVIFSWVYLLSAVIGRIAGGYASDKLIIRYGFSRKPVPYFCTFGVAASVFLCLFITTAGELAALSILLGFCYGSGLAVFPV
ncbi:MAG: MFS transporter, partial [Deltaproteobacteria bacterium]|nr:MFS transporter [Deltaproteobacteria bacterium]